MDGDGRFDNAEDTNEDGLADAAAGLLSVLPDFDNDGLPNSRDLDADNDGLGDAFEMLDIPLLLQAGLPPLDIDGDGLPNNLDRDSDGDAILDTVEAGYPDLDADGVADLVNDHDSDGIPDLADVDLATGSDNIDTDGDGIADRFDADHSVETTTITNWSTLEQETILLPNSDIDADGIVDRHDPDHNGDGHADQYFEQQIQAADLFIDADGDGLIALRDNDDLNAFDTTAVTLAAALPDNSTEMPVSEPAPVMFVAAFNPCPAGAPQTTETNTAETSVTITDVTADADPQAPVDHTTATNNQSLNEEVIETSNIAGAAGTDDTLQLGAARTQGGSGSTGLWFAGLLLLTRRRRQL